MEKRESSFIVGDALYTLKKLAPESVDLGVTSPPYNKQENKKGWLVNNVRYDNYPDKKTEKEYQEDQIKVLNELYRVTKYGGSFFYNHKVRWEQGNLIHPMHWLDASLWTIRQEIIWDRMIAANIRGWRFWQTEERIYWLYKPIADKKIGREIASNHALLTSIWRFSPERDNPHPAPFPLVLPLRCIYSLLDDQRDATIIDPYVGSGTTAIAAKLLGHKFIGIDIAKKYIELAKERVKDVSRYRSILEQEKEKHFVRKTFQERKKNGEFTGKFRNGKMTPVLRLRTLFQV